MRVDVTDRSRSNGCQNAVWGHRDNKSEECNFRLFLVFSISRRATEMCRLYAVGCSSGKNVPCHVLLRDLDGGKRISIILNIMITNMSLLCSGCMYNKCCRVDLPATFLPTFELRKRNELEQMEKTGLDVKGKKKKKRSKKLRINENDKHEKFIFMTIWLLSHRRSLGDGGRGWELLLLI